MKSTICLLFIAIATFSHGFSQTKRVSPNGSYIAIDYKDICIMINADGKALYPLGVENIRFTTSEKYFYYCKDNMAYIFESATGKEVKTMEVLGTDKLVIDNDLVRYSFMTISNSNNSLTIVSNDKTEPLVINNIKYRDSWQDVYSDVSFDQNIVVVRNEDEYFLIDLNNPQNKIKLKVKNPKNCAIDKTNGNIVIGSYEDKAVVFNKKGETLAKHKGFRFHNAHGLVDGWILDDTRIRSFEGENLSIGYGFIDYSFITNDGKFAISLDENIIKYTDINTREEVRTIDLKDVLKDTRNYSIIQPLKQAAIYTKKGIYKLHTFSEGKPSPFQVDEEWTTVRGNKYLFSCGLDNTARYPFLTDLKDFIEKGDYRIEAAVKYLEGRDPFFGIFNEYRKNVSSFISVATVAKSGFSYSIDRFNHQDTRFSYAVNPGKERNVVVIEKEKNRTRIIVNGEVVLSGKVADMNAQYGFVIYNSGLAEADYIMISNIRDDDYYRHWRKQAGLNIDPFMVADFQGHSGVITDIKISPDGKEIVTCGKDKTIRIWDIETGENIRTFRTSFGKGDVGMYHRIAISPDKKYIAAGGVFSGPEGYEMGHVRFLDYETGKVVHVYDRLTASIQSMEFSPPSTPFKEQMFLVGTSNGENHYFRYHHFVNNLKNGFAEPDYKKIDAQMEKTWVTDIRLNPKYDEFLVTMDHWKFVRTFNLNHSDLGEGTTEVEIQGEEQALTACYSIGGDSIIVVRPNKIDIYDLKGNVIGNISASNYPVDYKVYPTPDGKHIVMHNKLYNIKTGKESTLNTGNIYPSKEGIVTREGLYLFAGYTYENPKDKDNINFSKPQEIGVIDLKTGKQIAQLKSKASDFEGITFAPNDKGIIFTKNYSGLEGAKTFQSKDIINYFDFEKLNITEYKGNPVSNNLVYEFEGNKLSRWGVEDNGKEDLGKLRYGDVAIRENSDYTAVVSYTLTPNGNVIVGTNFSLLLFNLKGDQIAEFIGHSGGVKALAISNDGKKLLSLGQDRIVKLWDLTHITEFIEPVASFVVSNQNDWICVNSDNYYASSKYGVKYLGFVQDRGTYTEADFYPFDQFDLVYNRPDIVLSNLGIENEELKKAYQRAYEKRLNKYGGIAVQNQENKRKPYILDISPSQVIESLQHPFMVNACDGNSKDKFSHFNFWINDVQVYFDQPKTDKSEMKLNLNVDLTPGKNEITVQPVNKAGILGIKKQVTYYANVPEQKPDLYIVAVGVSEYSNSEMNLRYAAKDAQDVISQFKSAGGYENVYTKFISNAEATRENILASKTLFKDSKPWDVTVIYFAGHGLLSSELDWFFATTDIDFNSPEKRGLAYFELEELFDSIPSRSRLLLLDACHSGEVDKEIMSVESGALAKNVGARGFKTIKKPELGLQNSFALMQTMFSNLERGTGAAVISSAGGAEFAFESSEWKNGVFTYALLEGLRTGNADADKNGEIIVSELRDYVFDRVKKLTNGQQNPTSRRENLEFDFRVW